MRLIAYYLINHSRYQAMGNKVQTVCIRDEQSRRLLEEIIVREQAKK